MCSSDLVRKDMRVMENWVRQIVEWVEEKKPDKESEEELGPELGDRERGEKGDKGEMESEGKNKEAEKKTIEEEMEMEMGKRTEEKMGDEDMEMIE